METLCSSHAPPCNFAVLQWQCPQSLVEQRLISWLAAGSAGHTVTQAAFCRVQLVHATASLDALAPSAELTRAMLRSGLLLCLPVPRDPELIAS